jgi:hypothetical protein
MVTGIVLSVFLLLATLAALAGVYKAHVLTSGAVFGSTSGSLAIIAFVISLSLFGKALKQCCVCSCSKK